MDITQDTELSSELMEIHKGSVDIRAKLDFMIKENSRLREKILELQKEKKKRSGNPHSEEPEAKKQKQSGINIEKIQKNVKEKISGYLVEINSLHYERRFLLTELSSAQEKLRAIYKQQKCQREKKDFEGHSNDNDKRTVEEEDTRTKLQEAIKSYKLIMNKMDEHYKKQIDTADLLLRKYMVKTDFLERSNKSKESIIEQLSKRLNGLVAASLLSNKDNNPQPLPKEFGDAYQSLEQNHQLLSEAYQILAAKYESLAGELSKYMNLVNKDNKEVIKALEDIIIEKENKLQFLTVENFKMKKECQSKDKVIGLCLKPHFEQANLKDKKGIKIILYKAHKEQKDDTKSE